MSEENPGFDRDDRSGDRFIISYYHFLSRGKMLMGRPKPFLNMHLRRAAGAHSGNGQGRGPRRGDFGSKRRARGQGFRFEFGRWLATSTERLRSLNTYGVRTRDEYTKRSGRSGWTTEHRVFGLAKIMINNACWIGVTGRLLLIKCALTVPLGASIRRNALRPGRAAGVGGTRFFEFSAMECKIVQPLKSFGDRRLAAPGSC